MKNIKIFVSIFLIAVSAGAVDKLLGEVSCDFTPSGKPPRNMVHGYRDGLFVLTASSVGVSAEVYVHMTCRGYQNCVFSLPTSIRTTDGNTISAILSFPAPGGSGNTDSSILSSNIGTVTCSR